ESTLSGLSLRKPIQLALDHGYRVKIVFFFLNSAAACKARIRERVASGGHSVPEADIFRRVNRSIRNFWTVYRFMANDWTLLYNGGSTLLRVASSRIDGSLVADDDAFANFLQLA